MATGQTAKVKWKGNEHHPEIEVDTMYPPAGGQAIQFEKGKEVEVEIEWARYLVQRGDFEMVGMTPQGAEPTPEQVKHGAPPKLKIQTNEPAAPTDAAKAAKAKVEAGQAAARPGTDAHGRPVNAQGQVVDSQGRVVMDAQGNPVVGAEPITHPAPVPPAPASAPHVSPHPLPTQPAPHLTHETDKK